MRARHKLGHELQVMARVLVLRDGLGERIGTAAVFHPAESLDALPHGERARDEGMEASQAELEERLQNEFEDFARGGVPFGVLWISVDQAMGCARRMARAPARRCLKRWSGRWRRDCGRQKKWGAGATMSS